MEKIIRRFISIALCVFVVIGCLIIPASAAKKGKLNKTSLKLYVGETFTLKLKGAKIKSIKSSDTRVVEIKSKNKILAWTAGKATVTVTDKNNNKYKCKLTTRVNPRNQKIFDAYSNIIWAMNPNYDSDMEDYYSLFDFTGDSTVELITTYGKSEGGKVYEFYTYKGGKAKKIGKIEAWHSALGYKKKGQLLQYQWHFSGATVYKLYMKNGKVKRKKIFYFSEGSDPNITLEAKLKKAGLDKIHWLETEEDMLFMLDEAFPTGWSQRD